MKKIAIFIFVILLGAYGISCQKAANLKITAQKKLVVYSFISPEEMGTKVYVKHTRPIEGVYKSGINLDTVYQHATVLLRSGSKTIVLPYYNVTGTYWVRKEDFPIEPGANYQLEVQDHVSGLTVKAQTTVPLLKAESIDYEIDSSSNWNQNLEKSYFINVSWDKLGAGINYYAYDMIDTNGYNSFFDWQTRLLATDETSKNGRVEGGYQPIIHSSAYTREIISRGAAQLLVYHVDKSLYDYFTYHDIVQTGGDGLGITQDPVTVSTNIEGGLGVFGSYRKSKKVIKELK